MSAKSITLLNWFSLFLAAFLSLWEQAWPTDCKSCSLFFSKSKVKFSQVITWSNGFDAFNAWDGYIYILYKLVNNQTYMTANEHDDTAEIIFKKYKRLNSLHINTKSITKVVTNSLYGILNCMQQITPKQQRSQYVACIAEIKSAAKGSFHTRVKVWV